MVNSTPLEFSGTNKFRGSPTNLGGWFGSVGGTKNMKKELSKKKNRIF